MTEQGFEKLTVWQKDHQLMLDIHKKLIPLLPKDEKYGLVAHDETFIQECTCKYC